MVVVENGRELSIGENYVPKNNVRDMRLTYNELNANNNSIIAFPFFSLFQLASFKNLKNQQSYLVQIRLRKRVYFQTQYIYVKDQLNPIDNLFYN